MKDRRRESLSEGSRERERGKEGGRGERCSERVRWREGLVNTFLSFFLPFMQAKLCRA